MRSFIPPEPDLASNRGRRAELGHRLTVAGDDNLFSGLNGTNEFGQTVLSFGNTHVHAA
jgi:hypothetical protein